MQLAQKRTIGEAYAAGASNAGASKRRLWAGRILSGLAVAFLAFDCTIKLLQLTPAVESTVQLVCLALYLIPRTAVLGAILWTGYLGGAIATHVRLGNPLFTHVLFPIYLAILIWGGLYLRDDRLRAIFPLRQAD